jgi:hypothetical protein
MDSDLEKYIGRAVWHKRTGHKAELLGVGKAYCRVRFNGSDKNYWKHEDVSRRATWAGRVGRSMCLASAFGETKPITEWLKDPRCAVSLKTIYARLDAGLEEEDAISTPRTRQAIP